jgi:sugar O-acyltransferase (sialic acid O-acetyltransferase NeuD family)
MTEATPIIIPLINPNEPGALLASLHFSPGQRVKKGDSLCTLETTKATLELAAERDGFLVGLTAEVGQTLQAGEVLAFLAEAPDWMPPPAQQPEAVSYTPGVEGLRISQAALALAQEHHLDLSRVSSETFITEKIVQQMIAQALQPAPDLSSVVVEPNSILVYGGGGHGKALIDLIGALGTFSILGIIDDGLPVGTMLMGVKVLGGSNSLAKLHEQGLQFAANAVGGIGNITSRVAVFKRLQQAGIICPALVHPTAFIEPSSIIAEGVQVMPHAYVGSEARLGFGTIVNTGAIVSHDCVLGQYVNLSPGAILAGEVCVGEAALIGMGVTVNLRVKIGSHARIGNSATIKQDVPAGSVVRAGSIWPQ